MSSPATLPPALLDSLRRAGRVVVLTGAGISAESGVPTFRQAQTGLWAQYDPQELATPAAFRRQPQLVWDWYAWRRELVAGVAPNPGHFALASMEAYVPTFTLITQNVDSLHQRAGSRHVIELHGNITRVKCSREERVVETWPATEERPPRCPDCGAFLRPDVVWFGEALPAAVLHAASEAARLADIFLTIGTSGLVQPAASLPRLAAGNGAVTVEINIEDTPLSPRMDYTLRGPSGVILPMLVERAWPD
ncbi:MAG TPA: NAD-dependent deacylase [Promineifilum sp.]|nr:NAD-dependent deacylase [Promineifilum sp.]